MLVKAIEASKESGEASRASIAKLESNHRLWLTTMFPEHFWAEDQFARHHDELWQHVWGIERGTRPKPGIAAWNRRGMKSTSAEALAPTLAALDKRDFGLYVSETQKKADGHLYTVKDMLAGSELGKYYPLLAKPEIKRIDTRSQFGEWNHNELSTAGGLYMMAVGLDVSVRGMKRGNRRPNFIIFDDIENEDDSFYVVSGKIERIKAGILAAGAEDCAIFMVQNLIQRDSVICQVLDGRADMLRGHKVFGGAPIPALRNDTYEETGTGANKQYFILAGEPTWVGFDKDACERELNTVGMRTWLLEYQHKVKTPYLDAIFPGFSEIHHVITWSEFARPFARFGSYSHMNQPQLPNRGNCAASLDLGTTIGHPTVHLWDWQPGEEMPCNGDLFFYRELCRPHFPYGHEQEIVVPEEVGMEIQDLERPWNENVKFRQGSHEAAAVRNSFGFFLGKVPGYKNIHYVPIKTNDKKRGITNAQDLLSIDFAQPHPFRIDPKTTDPALAGYVPEAFCTICNEAHEGSHIQGKPGMFLVVADGQGELYWNEVTGEYEVAAALDESGFARTRWEFPKYRHRKTSQGVETEELPKIDDDAMDCLIASVAYRTRKPEAKTDDMRVNEKLPEKFRKENVKAADTRNPYFEMNRYTAQAAVKAEMKAQEPRDWRRGARTKMRKRVA